MPMRLSCTLVEKSILGLIFTGWGTGSAIVPFKVRGGLEVRSWVVAFMSTVVRTENNPLRKETYGVGYLECKLVRWIGDDIGC